MLLHILLGLHIVICIALIGVILLQRSEGGAFGMGGGGGGGFMTARGAGDLLTRTTAILATAFFVLSMLLTIMSGRGGDGSVTDRLSLDKLDPGALAPRAPTPTGPSAPLPGADPLQLPPGGLSAPLPAAPQNAAPVPPGVKTQPADPLANLAGDTPQPANR